MVRASALSAALPPPPSAAAAPPRPRRCHRFAFPPSRACQCRCRCRWWWKQERRGAREAEEERCCCRRGVRRACFLWCWWFGCSSRSPPPQQQPKKRRTTRRRRSLGLPVTTSGAERASSAVPRPRCRRGRRRHHVRTGPWPRSASLCVGVKFRALLRPFHNQCNGNGRISVSDMWGVLFARWVGGRGGK